MTIEPVGSPTPISISYFPDTRRGLLQIAETTSNTIWDRLKQAASGLSGDVRISERSIDLDWNGVLDLLRDYGTKEQQIAFNFRFRPDGAARTRIEDYQAQRLLVRQAQGKLKLDINEEEMKQRLRELGFKRELKWFQSRDLRKLLSLQHGANFSVPGAGKTTVAFALHLLTRSEQSHVLVVCPKAAFTAWTDVVEECMGDGGDFELFEILSGTRNDIERRLADGGTRFVINYDMMIQIPDIVGAYLARNRVHLIVDESHRMKAGMASQRGALLLNLSPLPVRRDILSGTPMPQSPDDLGSQLNFLWPGQGLGMQLASGRPPKEVLGDLYVRTTKNELDLPPRKTLFHQVGMSKGQLALYGLVRDESLRQLSSIKSGTIDIVSARRSVMRLLQLSTNPVLALKSMSSSGAGLNSNLADQIFEDGPSPKMLAVASLARELASQERKCVIWSIFTDTIEQLSLMLAGLNPVTVYGAIPSGVDTDPNTREGRLRRFHTDAACTVLIANPAAAGEGISLHTVCHEALYVDRSYVSTHFLQSIDRIHRLGLRPDTVTNIHIFQTKTPQGLGAIDHSVSRRLAQKIRALEQLLDDEDLRKIAIEEEDAAEPIEYEVKYEDLIDLVEELEGGRVFDENEGA